MSQIQLKLCHKIINEHFGKIVAEVAKILLQKGSKTLSEISSHSKLPKVKIQESLCVLIKHNLVVFEEQRPNVPAYSLLNDRVLYIIRFPRFVYMIREMFGEEAEMVVDFFSKNGQSSASLVIVQSALKLLNAVEGEDASGMDENKHIAVRNAFEKLVNRHFVHRCQANEDPAQKIPKLIIKECDLYSFTPGLVNIKLVGEEINRLRAQSQNSSESNPALKHPDADVLWRLNYDQFNLELRDIELKKSISHRIDPTAGRCFEALLKTAYRRNDPWVSVFSPVVASEVRDNLPSPVSHFDQYLKVIVDNGEESLKKVGEAGGGEYVVNAHQAIRDLTISLVDKIIQERFGSKALRIFRLVRENNMMEQDTIVEKSMIGKKEANMLTNRLLTENFLKLYEVRKSIAAIPANKSIYLFHLDLITLVRMLLEWTYKTIYNLMQRRDKILQENSRLMERKTRVEMIVENLKQSGGTEDQIKEVEDVISASEREFANSVLEAQDKLFDCESGVDETVFVFQMFLYYETD